MNDDETVAEMLTEEDDGPSIPRRAVIATSFGAAAAAFVLFPTSEHARAEVTAEELIAEDDEIVSHDGSIDSIDVDPVIAVEWEGFNGDSTAVELEIAFDTGDETEITVYEESATLEGTNGEETFDYGSVDLLQEGWSAETFEADSDDSDESTEVTAEIRAEAPDEDIETVVSDSFTVTVTNHPASVDVGGEIQTTVESDEEVGDE